MNKLRAGKGVVVGACSGKTRAAAALLAVGLLCGCAAPQPATRPAEEKPGVAVRLPGTHPMDIDVRTEKPVVQPELPPSAPLPNNPEEAKGLWLRMFEVERIPGKKPPPAPEERTLEE